MLPVQRPTCVLCQNDIDPGEPLCDECGADQKSGRVHGRQKEKYIGPANKYTMRWVNSERPAHSNGKGSAADAFRSGSGSFASEVLPVVHY